jgi:hypothetical protein
MILMILILVASRRYLVLYQQPAGPRQQHPLHHLPKLPGHQCSPAVVDAAAAACQASLAEQLSLQNVAKLAAFFAVAQAAVEGPHPLLLAEALASVVSVEGRAGCESAAATAACHRRGTARKQSHTQYYMVTCHTVM